MINSIAYRFAFYRRYWYIPLHRYWFTTVIFTVWKISYIIISSHTATKINYRMAVPAGSDFYGIAQFPEVYHARGITTPAFYGGERAVTGQEGNTIYRRKISWRSGTCCVCWPQHPGGRNEDPELV